jgi:hypothetical protein
MGSDEDENEDSSNESVDPQEELEEIKGGIEFLRVGKKVKRYGEHCLNLLTNSERIYYEMAFADESEKFSIVLMPWKTINLETEIRCFIKNNKLIGISQYYGNLSDVFDTNFISKLKKQVIHVVNKFNDKTDLKSYTLDVYVDEKQSIQLIESNDYNASDKCLFGDNELDDTEKEKLPFLVRISKNIVEF